MAAATFKLQENAAADVRRPVLGFSVIYILIKSTSIYCTYILLLGSLGTSTEMIFKKSPVTRPLHPASGQVNISSIRIHEKRKRWKLLSSLTSSGVALSFLTCWCSLRSEETRYHGIIVLLLSQWQDLWSLIWSLSDWREIPAGTAGCRPSHSRVGTRSRTCGLQTSQFNVGRTARYQQHVSSTHAAIRTQTSVRCHSREDKLSSPGLWSEWGRYTSCFIFSQFISLGSRFASSHNMSLLYIKDK